jgi:hypothetical protein
MCRSSLEAAFDSYRSHLQNVWGYPHAVGADICLCACPSTRRARQHHHPAKDLTVDRICHIHCRSRTPTARHGSSDLLQAQSNRLSTHCPMCTSHSNRSLAQVANALAQWRTHLQQSHNDCTCNWAETSSECCCKCRKAQLDSRHRCQPQWPTLLLLLLMLLVLLLTADLLLLLQESQHLSHRLPGQKQQLLPLESACSLRTQLPC